MPRVVKVGKVYHAEFFDSTRGFTTRRTTGTDDRREALRILGELIAKDAAPKTVSALRRTALADVLAAYYAENKELPSKYSIKAALTYVLEELKTNSVEWFNEDGQKEFIRRLRARKLSDGTIQRTMGIVGRALRLAYRKAGGTERPYIVTVKASGRRTRLLTDDEARSLLKAVETENERRLMLLLLTTGSRPQALMDLTMVQVDRANKLLFLNPPGRVQNEKKHRPTIPMTHALYVASASWQDGPVFQTDHGRHGGKQVRNCKYIWNRLRVRAGIAEEVTPYTIRHTVATELRRQGVPEWDVSGYLGHKDPGSSTTSLYAHWRPDYMRAASEAMDKYWRRLNVSGTDAVDAGGTEGSHPSSGASESVLGAGGTGAIWGIDQAP